MKKLLITLMAFVLLAPALGLAADLRNAEVVSKDEAVHNLYMAAQNPTVDGNVTGDLVVAGSVVTVNGSVENDVFAAGSTLNLNGPVGQNVRVAGGTVNINDTVKGDLIVFGGNVLIGTKAVITGDVIVFAGSLDVQGTVSGNILNSFAGNVTLAGKVAGNVALSRVGTLEVQSSSVIGGSLKYSSQNQGTVSSDARVGKVEFTKVAPMATRNLGAAASVSGFFLALLIALVAVLVFISLFPKYSREVVEASMVSPLKSLGIGILGLVLAPIVLLLLLVTLLGWGVMGYLLLAYVAFLAVAGTLSSVLVGAFVWKYFAKVKELPIDWKTASLGVLLVTLTKVVPIIGGLVVFLIVMLVFGTVLTLAYSGIRSQRA